MPTERYYEHQSLALLAGVAVDKGPEETLGESHTLQLVDPSGTFTLSSSSSTDPGPFRVIQDRPNVIQTSSRNESVRLPLMTNTSEIDEALSDNVVEVQYIIDPGGQFQITSDDDSGEINNPDTNKIILSSIDAFNVSENVIEFQQTQSSDLQVYSRGTGNTCQLQAKSNFKIEEGNIVIVQESTQNNEELMQQHIIHIKDSSIQDENIVGSQNEMYSHTSNYNSSWKCCFVCQESGPSWKSLHPSSSNTKNRLAELLNLYMNISVPTSHSNSDCIICDKCEQMLLRWHEVVSRHRKEDVPVSAAFEISEDENSVGEQSGTTKKNKQDDYELESTNDKNTSIKKNSQKKSGLRKCRYSTLQNQIKTQIFSSAYQYLIKRDLRDEDWEYIAERLHTTKSNSSSKMKEIETLTFLPERLVSIFCDECKKSIPGGKDGYYDHRKAVHANNPVEYTLPCDICGKYFPEQDSTGLSRNYFPHWIKHFYFQECHTCTEKFPNPSLLKKHTVAHQQRPVFPCPKCNKVLSKKTTLEQHIKTHLPDEEKKKNALTCQLCGKMITAPTLKAHMFSVHSDLRPWRCEVCGAKFKHKSDLTGHRNAVHLKIKKFNCNLCGKSFGHHCGLRVHMMKHENRREHECTVCGKRFITQWHLKKHAVTHKEERDFICETCGKGFKKVESLQEHMTLHTGEFPYECHICGRKVRVLSNLYKHFMVHKKNKTYYSKKDGLPDPLDAYINEQRERKHVNSSTIIVDETVKYNSSAVGQTTAAAAAVISIPSSTGPGTLQLPDSTEVDPEMLQVNRSSARVTYPGSTTSTTGSVSSSIPSSNNSRVIMPSPGGQASSVYHHRLQSVEGSTLLECNSDNAGTNITASPGTVIQSSLTPITASTSTPYLTYRIIDENGVEMDTIRIPS